VKKQIELLAPGGDLDSIKAAILAGADAVYCGLERFNARNRAANISFADLQGVLRIAHQNSCKVFVTINIIIVESEISSLIILLNKLVNTSVDGIIIQDLGLFYILNKYFKSLKIHASTQMTTHNAGQIKFLSKLNSERVNLSRELNIHEIKQLTSLASENNVLTEVFVHGSNCISFSGLCYISSVLSGNSGNRGRCSQPCRDKYETTSVNKNYPLNLKDNSAFFDLKELADAGVASLKIEGRIKKSDYVFTVVNAWRKQLQCFYTSNKLLTDNADLYKVFNRDFSDTFLKGDINKDMFIDDPRDHSIQHLSEVNDFSNDEEKETAALKLYDEKDEIKKTVADKIKQLSFEKLPLEIIVSGENGGKLKIEIKTYDACFEFCSDIILVDNAKQPLNREMLLKRLKAIDDTDYFIEELDLSNLNSNLFLPFGEITSMKNKIISELNGGRNIIENVVIPNLQKNEVKEINPNLFVLISSVTDLHLCDETTSEIFFQLPNTLKNRLDEFVDIFKKNTRLIPYFPSVIIGEDFDLAVKFLEKVNPNQIVTNNSGIAFEACELGVAWIAGPQLNIVNSYSLKTLKENFNCSGAFISSELGKKQIKNIKKPDDFNLYFSIYHPLVLMTSRQCLFHQVDGCKKNMLNAICIQNCKKTSTITNLKNDKLFIEKSRGNFNNIYNEYNYLNTEIIYDLPNFFSGFMIDLRDIKTNTKLKTSKVNLIKSFVKFVEGNNETKEELKDLIIPSINKQYLKGI
jgi:putative protease